MARTILIDGRSGAGKTTFAQLVGEETGFHVIHLDEFYPGWGGLVEGSEMVKDSVLRMDNPGYFRWDWVKNEPGQWVDVDPESNLVIEGVGALTESNVEASRDRYRAAKCSGEPVNRENGCLTVWTEVPGAIRKERALARDPGFVDFWDMWARQEDEFMRVASRRKAIEKANMKLELSGASPQVDKETVQFALGKIMVWVQ